MKKPIKKVNLKKVHKSICHLCKIQIKEGGMWGSFKECVEYSKRHNQTYRDLYMKKYGIDYRKKDVVDVNEKI